MKLTNKYQLPDTFVEVIKGMSYDPRESDPKRIGITTLINNPRPKILTVKHWGELEEDVSEHIWRVLGNSVHYIVSKVEKIENRLIENKLEQLVDGLTIVAKPDLYNKGCIEDYKITSTWSIKMGDKIEWEYQLNAYAWMLRKADHVVEKLQINAILKDWRKGEVTKYDDYPPIPFVVVPIKLWSFEEQDEYIRHRVDLYKEALASPIEELPICSKEERWAKPDVYAVYKGSNSKRAERLLESLEIAEKWASSNVQGKYRIVKREGEDTKCKFYCAAAPFCSYAKERYQ